jgi:hypothetical protein
MPSFAIVWTLYVAGSVADCITTQIALRGGLHERNPLAAGLYTHAGMGALWALKAAVVSVILILLTRIPRQVALVVAGVFAITMGANVSANIEALRTVLL